MALSSESSFFYKWYKWCVFDLFVCLQIDNTVMQQYSLSPGSALAPVRILTLGRIRGKLQPQLRNISLFPVAILRTADSTPKKELLSISTTVIPLWILMTSFFLSLSPVKNVFLFFFRGRLDWGGWLAGQGARECILSCQHCDRWVEWRVNGFAQCCLGNLFFFFLNQVTNKQDRMWHDPHSRAETWGCMR